MNSVLDELTEFDHQQARLRMQHQATPVVEETAADFWRALLVAVMLIAALYCMVLVAAGVAA